MPRKLHNQQSSTVGKGSSRSGDSATQSLSKYYKFNAKTMSSWSLISQPLLNASLGILQENISKIRTTMSQKQQKKTDEVLAQFYVRAKDKLKQIKTPKNKIKLHERNEEIQQQLEAAKKDLADVNDKMKEWIQSCEDIDTKVAELEEYCQSRSFDVQALVPTMKASDDLRGVEQRLQESHVAYHNQLPAFTVI
ncbi:uncharacterized protein [Dysidea avara]|uniref:uncharacterized protein isoform X1 n=1 Tax=Dysidea avara TaxID=196820 RepID=UPI0033305B3C